jgi:phage gp36-like protein
MPYIDRAGLEARFGADEIAQLLDDDRSGTEEAGELAALDAACADAATLIDGYLAARYPLPLLVVPDIVSGWAADIARFRLWDEAAPDNIRRRFDDVLAQLRDLAAGRLALPPGATGEAAAAPSAMDGFSADRVFTMDSLRCF